LWHRLVAVLAVSGSVILAPPWTAPAAPLQFDVQAHAGGRAAATGESLRAFTKSLELGVSTLEFDINISSDDQPLVWHDPIIKADQCDDTEPAFSGDPQYPYVGKAIRDLTVAQIRTLNCGKPAEEFPRAEVVTGNKIATLPEVFELTDSYHADVRYNIETQVQADQPDLSASPQQFVDVILAAVRSAGKTDRVEIQSFDWRTLRLVRQAEPLIPLVALWNAQTWRPGSPWLAGVDASVVGDAIIGATMVGATILSPDYALVAGNPFVEHAHAHGLQVIPWTVDDTKAMRQLIVEGVDGIITDYPALLRAVLADRGMALPPAYQRS
jgi:glycerophosphoryl diester phosphodiesterase